MHISSCFISIFKFNPPGIAWRILGQRCIEGVATNRCLCMSACQMCGVPLSNKQDQDWQEKLGSLTSAAEAAL